MVKYEKYETKSGKKLWRYYGYFGTDPKTGKKIKPRGQGFISKAEAKLAYERTIEEIKGGKLNTRKRKLTFSELTTEFLEYYSESGIKPGTYRKFKIETERHLLPIIGTIFIDQLDVDDCQKCYEAVKKNRKDHSKIINQAERILDYAVSKRYLDSNPMKNILRSRNKLHYSKKRLDSSENFYTPTQLMDFLEAFREVEEFHKFVYFRLLAFTGLRRGEALSLYESDILKDIKAVDVSKTLAEDENGKTYVSSFPKTEESKNLVYLDDDTFNFIEELIKNRYRYDSYGKIVPLKRSNFLFPSPKTGKHYHRSAPNEWLRTFFDRNEEALSKRNIPRISPHGFRHSQATLLYELGVDPKDAQSRLRHKNLKTTMDIYTHISEARKRTPLTKLDEFSSRGTTSGTTSDQHSQNKS